MDILTWVVWRVSQGGVAVDDDMVVDMVVSDFGDLVRGSAVEAEGTAVEGSEWAVRTMYYVMLHPRPRRIRRLRLSHPKIAVCRRELGES